MSEATVCVSQLCERAELRRHIDIFRFDPDGKIVERWDVLQVIPESAANDNSMF